MNQREINAIKQLRGNDPKAALAAVRRLGNSATELQVKAVVLVDCGEQLGDFDAIDEGCEIFRKLNGEHSDNMNIKYNFANALQVKARHALIKSFVSDEAVFKDRLQSRVLFGQVLRDPSASPETRSKMATNIGILFLETSRWVEAIDWFQYAQDTFPKNAVAAYQEMRRLMHLAVLFHQEGQKYQSYCHLDALCSRIRDLAELVRDNIENVSEFAGPQSLETVNRDVDHGLKLEEKPKSEIKCPYYRFVFDKALPLSLIRSTEEYNSGRFDLLSIPSITTMDDHGSEVPEIFAMLNVMKADFALARQMFYDARSINESIPFRETASYGDTLDYAVYGVRYAGLNTAQRIALDVLDKIAVALAVYLHLPKAETKDFIKLWGKRSAKGNDKRFVLDEKIKRHLDQENPGIVALFHLFHDLSRDDGDEKNDGFLRIHKHFRNASTHRFTVLHDMGLSESSSKSVEHVSVSDMEEITLQSLKLARAALFYFVDAIIFGEDGKNGDRSGVTVELQVLDHSYVRGHY